jgi:hypothetical protein
VEKHLKFPQNMRRLKAVGRSFRHIPPEAPDSKLCQGNGVTSQNSSVAGESPICGMFVEEEVNDQTLRISGGPRERRLAADRCIKKHQHAKQQTDGIKIAMVDD